MRSTGRTEPLIAVQKEGYLTARIKRSKQVDVEYWKAYLGARYQDWTLRKRLTQWSRQCIPHRIIERAVCHEPSTLKIVSFASNWLHKKHSFCQSRSPLPRRKNPCKWMSWFGGFPEFLMKLDIDSNVDIPEACSARNRRISRGMAMSEVN